jgi:pyruvate formate-lyase activating enzyme-like uncharacterized protein
MELVAPQDNQAHPPNLHLPIGGDDDYEASYCSSCIKQSIEFRRSCKRIQLTRATYRPLHPQGNLEVDWGI